MEGRLKGMSAQGKERIDHVWMKVLDQRNEGVGKTELNERRRDETGIGGRGREVG